MRQRMLLAAGAALMVAGGLAPIAPVAAGGASAWAAHDAMVQAIRARGYLVGDQARFDALKAAAIARSPGWHGASARTGASPTSPTPRPSWSGVSENDLSPPDSTGAIGPTEYIEAINIMFGIYSRSGGTIATGPAEVLTGTSHLDLSDPQILFDKDTNRFYYEFLDVKDDTFRWGFSKTRAPHTVTPADWCSYTADFGYGANLPDYPKMGQTKHSLVIGANIYANLATYLGSDLDFIQKPSGTAPISTCPGNNFKLSSAKALKNADGTPFASDPNPGVQSNPGTTAWVAAVPDATNSGAAGNYVDLFDVTENGNGTDTASTATAISVTAYAPPPPAPQKGTNDTLDTLDGRLTHAVTDVDPSIAGGNHPALWTSHAVAGGAGSRVDWYEIDVFAKTLKQQGSITDPKLFVFDAGVSDDRAVSAGKFGSNMVAGFTTSSASAYPANQSVTKLGTGPQSAFIRVHQSPGADQGFDCFVDPGKVACRWGDYGGAVPDPVAPSTATAGRVWMSNMDATGGGPNPLAPEWGTWNWALVA